MENLFKKEWELIDKPETHPKKTRNIVKIPWDEFKKKVISQDPDFVRENVRNIYAGDVYILQNTYAKEFMREMINKTFEWGKTKPSSFHKMLESCPDFHRLIDILLSNFQAISNLIRRWFSLELLL